MTSGFTAPPEVLAALAEATSAASAAMDRALTSLVGPPADAGASSGEIQRAVGALAAVLARASHDLGAHEAQLRASADAYSSVDDEVASLLEGLP